MTQANESRKEVDKLSLRLKDEEADLAKKERSAQILEDRQAAICRWEASRREEEEKSPVEEEAAPLKAAEILQLISSTFFTLLTHSSELKRFQQLRQPKPPPEIRIPRCVQL